MDLSQRSGMVFAGTLLLAVCFLLLLLGLSAKPRFLEELEYRTWDWRLRLAADPREADPDIRLILIDQASLDFLEREYSLTWPIPRDAYKHIISFLTAAGAKGLAFDLLFTESSAQAVESDREFAKAVGGGLPVVSAISLDNYEKYISEEKLSLLEKRQRGKQEQAAAFFGTAKVREFPSATLPIPELIESSTGLGSVHAFPDSDGVYRRYEVGGRIRDVRMLGLPFALFAETIGDPPAGFSKLIGGDAAVVVRPHGGGGTYKSISFAEVLQSAADVAEGKPPRLSPELFKNTWVFLGASAPGLLDLRPSSLERRGNGVEFVATVFDNLRHSEFAREPSLLASSFLGFLLIVALVVSVLHGSGPKTQLFLSALVLSGYFAGGVWAAAAGWWIPMVVPSLTAGVAILASLYLQYQFEGKQHRFIRRAFQYYVSPSVVKKIVEDPRILSLGGERRELSIFFSDIAGFTSIAEKLPPAAVAQMLNEYLTLMSDIIQGSGGTVDKYVGDAVVAFWNAPIPIEEHELRAVETSLHIQRELEARGDQWEADFGARFHTRIGVHTAVVSVGNFGSKSRFSYTMIGDGANLASRLEGVNKMFGTLVLISAATQEALEGKIRCRLVGDIKVAGKNAIVRVFEPEFLSTQSVFQGQNLEIYHRGLASLKQKDFAQAKADFSRLPDDPVSRVYLSRIEQQESREEPWSSVWEFSEK